MYSDFFCVPGKKTRLIKTKNHIDDHIKTRTLTDDQIKTQTQIDDQFVPLRPPLPFLFPLSKSS